MVPAATVMRALEAAHFTVTHPADPQGPWLVVLPTAADVCTVARHPGVQSVLLTLETRQQRAS